jgi:hypothetical protein
MMNGEMDHRKKSLASGIPGLFLKIFALRSDPIIDSG